MIEGSEFATLFSLAVAIILGMNPFDFITWLWHRFTDEEQLPTAHPECGERRCKSCDRVLTTANHHHIPHNIDCCHHCWKQVPIAERLKIAIMVDDRESGGLMNLVSACAEAAILERRNER